MVRLSAAERANRWREGVCTSSGKPLNVRPGALRRSLVFLWVPLRFSCPCRALLLLLLRHDHRDVIRPIPPLGPPSPTRPRFGSIRRYSLGSSDDADSRPTRITVVGNPIAVRWSSTSGRARWGVRMRSSSSPVSSPPPSRDTGALEGGGLGGGEREEEEEEEEEEETAGGDSQVATAPSGISPPPRLFHHWTVCVVPPPERSRPVWDAITEARTALRDPGLYRWPPHSNLLYPFVDCYREARSGDDGMMMNHDDEEAMRSDGDDGIDATRTDASSSLANNNRIDFDILMKLRNACRQVRPFGVQLRELGTFGGSKRGVLWLDSRCPVDDNKVERGDDGTNELDDDNDGRGDDTRNSEAFMSPLVLLQGLLEQEFPYCTAQRMAGNDGVYRPHMTLSHFVNVEAAQHAKMELETRWRTLSNNQTDFVVDRVYVLTRKGDDGQFQRVAEVMLGPIDAGRIHDYDDSNGIIGYEPNPLPFPDMPVEEDDWVREQRMAPKKRRNHKWGRGRRRRRGRRGRNGGGSGGDIRNDSPRST